MFSKLRLSEEKAFTLENWIQIKMTFQNYILVINQSREKRFSGLSFIHKLQEDTFFLFPDLWSRKNFSDLEHHLVFTWFKRSQDFKYQNSVCWHFYTMNFNSWTTNLFQVIDQNSLITKKLVIGDQRYTLIPTPGNIWLPRQC